jgi:hypothetical protein
MCLSLIEDYSELHLESIVATINFKTDGKEFFNKKQLKKIILL